MAANGRDRVRMAGIRPELLGINSFWPTGDGERADIIVRLAPGTLPLEEALRLFGPSIETMTVTALIRDVTTLSSRMIASLLKVDQSPVRDTIAEWVVSSQDRLVDIARWRQELDRRAVETLAKAQIRKSVPLTEPGAWADLIIDGFGSTWSSIDALNVVGYLSALAVDGPRSLDLARQVFDPLERSVRARTLSRIEESYLSQHISVYSQSWSLSKALLQSALTKWPVTSLDNGALGLVGGDTALDEMMEEILIRYGRSQLEDILQLPQLPERARSRIQHVLTPSKKKLTLNIFPWLR